jgi:hypothetical protein
MISTGMGRCPYGRVYGFVHPITDLIITLDDRVAAVAVAPDFASKWGAGYCSGCLQVANPGV